MRAAKQRKKLRSRPLKAWRICGSVTEELLLVRRNWGAELRSVVPHVADCGAYLPRRHPIGIERPEQVYRQLCRISGSHPAVVILWREDHRHAVVNR